MFMWVKGNVHHLAMHLAANMCAFCVGALRACVAFLNWISTLLSGTRRNPGWGFSVFLGAGATLSLSQPAPPHGKRRKVGHLPTVPSWAC